MNSPARIGRQPPPLSGAPWPGSRIDAAALDRGLREAVGEAEVLGAAGQRRARLAADHGDPAVALDRLAQHPRRAAASAAGSCALIITQHVDLAAAERRLPVLRGALADIAQQLGARRHAGAEVVGEAGERRARDAERLEPGVREGDVDPRLRLGLPRSGGQDVRGRLGQQRAGARRVVDAQEQVARGGQPVAADHEALDRGELERLGHVMNSAWKRACSSGRREPLRPHRELDQLRAPREVGVHLGDGLVAVGAEEQRALDLVVAEVGGERGRVCAPRVAGAVAPDRVGVVGQLGAQRLEVGVERPVEVAREQQPRGLQRIAALAAALVDDVLEDHPAREVGAGNARQRAGVLRAEGVEVGGERASRGRRGSGSARSARRPGRSGCGARASQVALHVGEQGAVGGRERLGVEVRGVAAEVVERAGDALGGDDLGRRGRRVGRPVVVGDVLVLADVVLERLDRDRAGEAVGACPRSPSSASGRPRRTRRCTGPRCR